MAQDLRCASLEPHPEEPDGSRIMSNWTPGGANSGFDTKLDSSEIARRYAIEKAKLARGELLTLADRLEAEFKNYSRDRCGAYPNFLTTNHIDLIVAALRAAPVPQSRTEPVAWVYEMAFKITPSDESPF